MEFNLEQIDTLLSTTRAVRRRLDFNREVPDEVLLRCIDLAEQAPSGGNVASRRWLVMRDPDTKARLAALYRDAGGRGLIETAERLHGSTHAHARVVTSAAYLAQHLERVPVLVLVTIWGTHDGSGRPGLFDSLTFSPFVARHISRRCDLSPRRCRVHRLHRRAPLRGLLVPMAILFDLLYTARHCATCGRATCMCSSPGGQPGLQATTAPLRAKGRQDRPGRGRLDAWKTAALLDVGRRDAATARHTTRALRRCAPRLTVCPARARTA
jgi:nitroreductase